MSDMEREVTISLYSYNNLLYKGYEHKNLIDDLREVIESTETLSWNKDELRIDEKIIPVLKRYLPNTYKEQFEKLSKAGEKDDK